MTTISLTRRICCDESQGRLCRMGQSPWLFLRDAAPTAGSMRSCGAEDILLDIDVQGASKIKRKYPQAVSIFLLPPSWRELQRRLARRGTDGKETIRRRLVNARGEIGEIIKYDYYVVNREVGTSVQLLKSIVEAERAKTFRVKQWRIEPLHRRQGGRGREQGN